MQNMSVQQENNVIAAIKKFQEAFYVSGFHSTPLILRSISSLLYLMSKNSIVVRENVTDAETCAFVKVILSQLEGKYDKLHSYWADNHIRNKALIALKIEKDVIDESSWHNVKYMSNSIKEPVKILQFVEEIANNKTGVQYYLNVLDLAISIFSSNPMTGQFSQPVELSDLASKILNVKGKSVFNPFSGMMSYATSLQSYDSFTGIEIDSAICEIGTLRIRLAHLANKANCILGNASEWTKNKYDVIVSTPPFGMHLFLKGESRPIKSEWLCIRNFEDTTTANGELFTYVLPSVLFDSSLKSMSIRQEIIEKNYLDAVIELPKNLLRPYTSISLVALKLKKRRDVDEPIKMIDASSLFARKGKNVTLDIDAIINNINTMPSQMCLYVTREEIKANNYIWSVSKYLRSKDETFPEGFQVVKIKEIATIIKGEKSFNDSKGRLVSIADLSTSPVGCIKHVDSFEISDNLFKATKITVPVILLSSIRVLHPTFCEASQDNPIFINPGVIALKIVSEWVSPSYLCLELSRRFVQTKGVIIPRISINEILDIKIAFPSIAQERSIEEQNNLFNEAVENINLTKIKEHGLQSVIERMKTEYINTVRTRKHDMMPYMRELGSISRMLKNYVERYGSPELQTKVSTLLSQFDNAYKGLSALVEVFSHENEFGTPEKLNIDSYLRELVNNYMEGQDGFKVEYYCDDNALKQFGLLSHAYKSKGFSLLGGAIEFKVEVSNKEKTAPLFIDMASIDLNRMVRNIIENARVHGFIDNDFKGYKIDIFLTVDSEKGMFQIDFCNNGNPLPKGINKDSYGILGEKAGLTGRTGQGGYIVKSIVEHYHGDYDVFMEDDKTVIRILLPISNNIEKNV